MNSAIKMPPYSLLKKENLGDKLGMCECCGRAIKYVYTIRDNNSKTVVDYGNGCAKKVMGQTIHSMVQENIAYEKALNEEERIKKIESMGKTYIEAFSEAEPEMLTFISENEDNSFLSSMKTRIEECGTLTKNQYESIWRMMLPDAVFDKKVKDLYVYVLKMSSRETGFGWSYTLTVMTKDGEKGRIFFSSLNDKNEKLLEDLGVLKINRDGYDFISTIEKRFPIKVSGSFDGYKIKRASIERAEA